MDEKVSLLIRARNRNGALRTPLDWGGVLSPLMAQQMVMDELSAAMGENFIAISDETWGIKEGQRDQASALSQAEVDQDLQIAGAKAATGRLKLAIQRTTDEYAQAARTYDAKVKSLVMAAKEYAGRVEQEQLAVEGDRGALAVSKEILHRDEVNAKIFYEEIQSAQVEADMARAQVEVAKAHVRAAMAGVEAGQAEIELTEAEIQQAMSLAEKATLQANVAMTYAEIMTKKLSTIRLGVSQQEIKDGFSFIQSRLNDVLALVETRKKIEAIRTATETELLKEHNLAFTAEKARENEKVKEALYELEVEDIRWELFINSVGRGWAQYIEDRGTGQQSNIGAMFDENRNTQGRESSIYMAKQEYAKEKIKTDSEKRDKQTWAEDLVNEATKYVHKHRLEGRTIVSSSVETISG